MSKLHQVDPTKITALQSRKSSAGGLADCFSYWHQYSIWCGCQHNPIIRAAYLWLSDSVPKASDVHECISWGDARMQNLMFHGTHCAALLDWDMVSLAGAEADLAWWALADHKYTASRGAPRLRGLKSPAEAITAWESLTGRKLQHMHWHLVFAAFRQALISLRLVQLSENNSRLASQSIEPSIGMQWLAHFLDISQPYPITLPFVGLDK